MRHRAAAGRLGGPLAASAALHVAVAATLFVLRPEPPPPLPPLYRVNLVAAPPGPRQIGVVRQPEAAPATPPAEAPPPPRAERNPQEMPAPTTKARPPRRQPTPVATPTPPRPDAPATRPQDAPTAGGGATGGRGADVANVSTAGIEFPFPGYLQNIVRQIAVRFSPDNPSSPLRAEIRFLVHRDGSISNVAFLRRSGAYGFDLEAQGAIEAAAAAGAFGPLPAGYPDDVLPVIFSFDPTLVR